MLNSKLENALKIVRSRKIILTQEQVLISMAVREIHLYHRRTFSCFLFVTHVLYLNSFPDVSVK